MDSWQPTRVLTAAAFEGWLLHVRLATLMRGRDPQLIIKVVPEHNPARDTNSGRWVSKPRIPVPAGWALDDVNPWSVCSYAGPLKAGHGSAWTVAEVDRLIDHVSAGGTTAGARLAALIDAHLDGSALDDDPRRVLREFLEEDFARVELVGLVRPDSSDDGTLTLNSAQNIHQAVAAGQRLGAVQLGQAEVLLRYAPWHFGYWGPFKAVVKAVPVDDLAEAYADALARLSGTDGKPSAPAATRVQNIDTLKDWFGGPSKKTRRYLARRVRRDLASLAKRSPEAYARVAARMLISWDQPLSKDAYAPAFVMLGVKSTLDSHSEYVRWPADMAVRRDAHPEIWNERPELVREVYRSVRSSVEALTWAFQVLDSLGAPPEVPADSIRSALDTTYPPLRRSACAALPRHPEIFDSLNPRQWTAFFQHGLDAELTHLSGGLTAQHQITSFSEALGRILAQPDAVTDRRARLALLYLAAPKYYFRRYPDAAIGALVAAIGATGLEYRSVWDAVVASMYPQVLVQVYRALVDLGAEQASLGAIAGALVGNTYLPPDLVLECIGSDEAKVVELGWLLIDTHGGWPFFFTRVLPSARPAGRIGSATALRVVTAAIARVEAISDVVELVRWALSTDIERSEVARTVFESPMGPSAVWRAIATDAGGNASRLATSTPETIRLIGDAVAAQQLSTAVPAQSSLVLRYVTENPARIAHDASFGVAAVAANDPFLQIEALEQLRAAGHVPREWLSLAETGVPAALQTARGHLASLTDTREIREAVLRCMDSEVPAVRDLGLELFRACEPLSEDRATWTALARSDDEHVQELVAEAALAGDRVDEQVLPEFDRRILTDQRPNRRAKELIRKRLDTGETPAASVSAQHISALLHLARGEIERDREWALMRLATLALHGVPVEGVEVSLTTEGVVGLEDVGP